MVLYSHLPYKDSRIPYWRCHDHPQYKEFRPWNMYVYPAWKLTCPLKINGWKMYSLYWNSPFLGDMLVFGGVGFGFVSGPYGSPRFSKVWCTCGVRYWMSLRLLPAELDGRCAWTIGRNIRCLWLNGFQLDIDPYVWYVFLHFFHTFL